MFAGLPPSSSELTERKSVVPPSPPAHSSPLGLVLATLAPSCFEIGGANIENPATSSSLGRGNYASAHWCTILVSAILDGLSMHLWCRRVTASSA
jgi:hypothetical protein